MLTQMTTERLRQMRLYGMAEAFLHQIQKPDLAGLTFEERFGLLVEHEWTYRQDRRLKRLLRQAKLRLSACLEDVDYQPPRGLDRALLRSLAACEWVRAHLNVLITGPTGVGKTYLACALAHAACRQGLSARYYRVPRLLSDLALARGDGSYPRLLQQLARVEVLVLDDWGLAPFTDVHSRDLLEVLDDRAERRSTIIASQLPLDHWHGAFPDPTVADAILDRVVHSAYKITLRGDSMRKTTSPLHQSQHSGS